jgi:hypothetical protein
MVHIVFSPNYKLDADLPPEIVHNTELPVDIEQFWPALALVSFSQQPQIDGGISAVRLPDKLLDVAPHIQAFWLSLRPIMVQILAEHPTLVGRRQGPGQVPFDFILVSDFAVSMIKSDAATGQPGWQLFDPAKGESYAVWVLKQFFDFLTGGPGFSI